MGILKICRGLDLRGRIFEKSIVWIEHLFGHEEEPLPGHAPIVQSLLSLKLHPQSRLQEVSPLNCKDASVRVLQHSVSPQLHLKAVWDVSLPQKETLVSTGELDLDEIISVK